MNLLLRSEILREIRVGTANLEPRWLKVEAAVSYSGISRTALYRILAAGNIRSSSIRCSGASRGIRLIDRASLDAYIESFAGNYVRKKAREKRHEH
jgi:hypothetical protein